MEDTHPRPLALIKLGDTFDALRERRGDFEHWILSGLGDTRLPVVLLDPRRGDALPAAEALSGAVLTGSHAMVSDREAWSEHTAAWLRDIVPAGLPVLGICYGHQLLAHALGGQTHDHPQGLEAGTVRIDLHEAAATDLLLRDLPGFIDGQAAHRQTVGRLPEGAVVLAGNDFDPHHAVRYAPMAWGVQFHPEFDADIARAYVQQLAGALRDQAIDPAQLEAEVRATALAAQLLGRFARLAEQHDARSR